MLLFQKRHFLVLMIVLGSILLGVAACASPASTIPAATTTRQPTSTTVPILAVIPTGTPQTVMNPACDLPQKSPGGHINFHWEKQTTQEVEIPVVDNKGNQTIARMKLTHKVETDGLEADWLQFNWNGKIQWEDVVEHNEAFAIDASWPSYNKGYFIEIPIFYIILCSGTDWYIDWNNDSINTPFPTPTREAS